MDNHMETKAYKLSFIDFKYGECTQEIWATSEDDARDLWAENFPGDEIISVELVA